MSPANTLFAGVDFQSREFYANPFPTFAALRRESPVHWDPLGGMWVVSRYEDIRTIASQAELFSSSSGYTLDDNVPSDRFRDRLDEETRNKADAGELTPAELRNRFVRLKEAAATAPDPPGNKITTLDPPLHGRLRAFVSRAFTPRMVAHYHEQVDAIVTRALDNVTPGVEFDFVKAVSIPIPAEVIAVFLGVPPEDFDDFVGWSDTLAQTFDEQDPDRHQELHEQAAKMRRYTKKRLAASREKPGDDMLTALLNAEIDGERLTEADMISFARTFLFAGNETTRHLISAMVKLLAEHPEQRRILVEEPDLIPTAVEEFLRYHSPVWGLLRTATEDTEVAGQAIGAGDLIYLLYASANRDESIWEGAEEFDVRREPSPPHMGFGWGPHRCLGSNLARLEAKLTCEHLLERFPEFELAGDPGRFSSATFNGIVSLPVVMH